MTKSLIWLCCLCFPLFLFMGCTEGTQPNGTKPPKPSLNIKVDEVFKTKVFPVLKGTCMKCHAKGKNRSPFVLFPDRIDLSYRNSVYYAKPKDPAESLLLLKPVDPGEGGVIHGGGSPLKKKSGEYKTIVDWVASLKKA